MDIFISTYKDIVMSKYVVSTVLASTIMAALSAGICSERFWYGKFRRKNCGGYL